MEKLKDINQLEKEVTNLNQIINEYTLLRGDTDNIGLKKSCEFFVNHMVKKKLNIQQIIDNIYSSIITMPSEE